jgi:IclR family acetate operon transcriptional repressor
MTANKNENLIKSVNKALTVLEYLSVRDKGEKLSAISQDLGISIATMHRILATMAKKGFIEQDGETKRYLLGHNARLLGISVMNQTDLFRYGLPCLQNLSEETEETTNLVVRHKWQAVYILQVESKNSLRVANRVGSRAALYCTAAGKILLTFTDTAIRQKYYLENDLIQHTHNTIHSWDELEREIADIKRTYIAYDREEQATGESCIASPVFNHNGDIVASISISSPSTRMPGHKMKEFSHLLRRTTEELSKDLGFNNYQKED